MLAKLPAVRFSFLLILMLVLTSKSSAQQRVGINIDFFGYIDNREYKASYTNDKTILGTMLSPKLYFAIDSNNRIVTGLHYNQDFGINKDNKNWVKPIAYYSYTSQKFTFALGHMPRYERLKDVPRLVLADTFMYEKPNIEGIYFAYHHKGFQQRIFVDWLSKQSYTQRERFVVGTSGKFKKGILYLANDISLYHNALSSNDSLQQHIQDNGVALVRLGIDLSHKTALDSLSLEAGFAFGFDRVRSEYEMRFAKGFLAQLHLGYKRFFLGNTLYLGQAQNLPLGDSFYHHSTYNRLDIGWVPFRKGNLEGRFTGSLHWTPDATSNQQAFTLRYRFGKNLWKKQSSK